MAQIGTFTRIDDGSFSGAIRTLRLNAKVRFVPTDKDNDKAPDLRAYAGAIEIGAAWKRTARETGASSFRSSSMTHPSRPRSSPTSSKSTAATRWSGRAEA
jgi:uncharacterized protein (DUF736 family)